MFSEYREVFLEELGEQLQLMDDEILKLEQEGDSLRVIQSLFRAAHTLKGSSAAMGFEEMKQLTHEMEHLLDQVRSNKLEVTGPLIDLLFQSLDYLKQLKNDIERNDKSMTDISDCVEKLQTFTDMRKPATGSGPTMYSAPKPVLNLDTRLKVQEAQDHGLDVYWIGVQVSAECVIKGARAYVIHSNLTDNGEVFLTAPELEKMDEHMDGPFYITFLYAGNRSSQEMQALVADLTDVVDVKAAPLEIEETVLVTPSSAAQERIVHDEAAQTGKSKSQTIRVSVERLEHLMNLVGELVIDQTRIQQVERTQRRRISDDSVNELGQISDHLSRIIGDLQESVMKARMLPIEQLFNRFPRMIRDLSRDLGKEIDLVMEGKDTELDRTLIEEIADPLIHLIRNAVDHGIEMPEKREQSGKNRKGTLRIQAAHEDNQVVIYVEEDGAGIDPAKMRRSAVEKGIILAEEAEQLSDREAIDLIFRPGFSTAQAVSDISGRGVGMDIVRSHIEKLNGLIDIETKLGEGTCFKIKLPLTLAIIIGLLVKLQDQTFIIPMSNIAEIVRVTTGDIQTVRGQSVIVLRNQVIPVAWMHDSFHIRKMEKKKNIPLVIVGSAEKRLALAVDELIGNQEIVIKSLGSYIGKVDCIAGATILGDGKVALILEVSGIINKMGGN
ncbi:MULTISPECIES: chemotaxis protein CheA [unclassified Paenibacillus]|uniref:chemotaxis protein CheA n=1 Tax=unclassified Paenibacillus TaxID=185978 RepID=UPI001AE3D821|nr:MULTISPECIES: chemotaxis protein CheA [unclassified Paenibacillus]MBP1154951.1 two-component system chemotaxis sensor kinase CheA [Paenibacillus sp. PvP091]MBP1169665.1 two-component system chemotaxis sensor kinase CheA [Paenibacillus sp. PvR098]MBP2440693.1 two-component system chemotaxis sensor kinase CheA [Paenibacillus sp. PvP052]